jgi:DNA recombination protein RmuC
MTVTSLAIIFVLAALLIGLFFYFQKKLKERSPSSDFSQSLVILQNHINEMSRTMDGRLNEVSRTVDSRLQESNKLIQHQFSSSASIIKDVTEKLVKLDETNKQVVNFADQLRSLQDILKNPKQRGILGEYYLETVLKNVLPPQSYKLQYSFKNGTIVDAVIFIRNQVIPIDSKFSLENYNKILEAKEDLERQKYEQLFIRDLKIRIDETSKYIKPEENTMDFAFMFIPAEAIYYDLLVNKVGALKTNTRDLINYAYEKKVVIVSPTSFLAYLQTVLQGLRYQKAEDSVKEIIKKVMELGKHLSAYDAYFQKVGIHLGTTVNAYNYASKELKKIDKDVLRIGGEKIGVETNLIEKPAEEEKETIREI